MNTKGLSTSVVSHRDIDDTTQNKIIRGLVDLANLLLKVGFFVY